LSEMLRARTGGALDLLDSDHLRRVAAYPVKMLLSGSHFATFSDCDDENIFHPGTVTRLAGRTGERSLLTLAMEMPGKKPDEQDWRLQMMMRNCLWWDGREHGAGQPADAYLPLGGVAKLVARTPQGAPVVLAIKAGHNAENHNQNDVGSFILHADGETFLADPGRGLYSRQYFGPERYQNIFANSYGHSVPRIGGRLQREGREYHGEMASVDLNGPAKQVVLEFARAYDAPDLASLRRHVTLDAAGVFTLQDTARFAGNPVEVEEALLTWLEVETVGATAVLHGQRHNLKLTIEAPPGAAFQVERLEEACAANAKPEVLKRLTFVLPAAAESQARVRAEII
jgi:hypothetical protein